MNRTRKPRVTPSMAVALTALVFAMSGAGYAATQLTSEGHGAKAAKKKKAKRGPAGPQGPKGEKGDTGAAGANGTAGSPGAISFTGRLEGLNVAQNSNTFGIPSGQSVIVVDGGDATTISPNADLTMKNLSIQLTAAPGGTALRFFTLQIAPPDALASESTACIVLSNQETCSVPQNTPIPARSAIVLRSNVTSGNAQPADAMFSWTAE
jgi:hypothetical protein